MSSTLMALSKLSGGRLNGGKVNMYASLEWLLLTKLVGW
jgi:hypothetical protein